MRAVLNTMHSRYLTKKKLRVVPQGIPQIITMVEVKQNIFYLTKLEHILRVEPQKARTTTSQSYRFQEFGHISDSRHRFPRYVKCGQSHTTNLHQKPEIVCPSPNSGKSSNKDHSNKPKKQLDSSYPPIGTKKWVTRKWQPNALSEFRYSHRDDFHPWKPKWKWIWLNPTNPWRSVSNHVTFVHNFFERDGWHSPISSSIGIPRMVSHLFPFSLSQHNKKSSALLILRSGDFRW